MSTYATTTALSTVMIGVDFSATGMSSLGSKAIDHGEAEVNKYISKRYDISSSTFQTTTSIPPIVRMLTERLAEGYLWMWLSRGSKESMSRGKDLIKDAKENLQAIAEYKMDLLATSGSVIADSASTAFRVQCSTSDYTTTFNEDDELNWTADSDKLEDISDARD